jgi:hypothetical protein
MLGIPIFVGKLDRRGRGQQFAWRYAQPPAIERLHQRFARDRHFGRRRRLMILAARPAGGDDGHEQ